MHKLWKDIILPIFNQTKPKTIIEIGSDKGDNTKNILKFCTENNSKLISIDPSPQFDTEDLKIKYKNYFKFYKNLSLECIPKMKTYDTILLDGDHNWYTVYNELKQIEKNNVEKFPFIFLHDTSWPYARRDCYYNPETIPQEYITPYEKKGLYPESIKLVDFGMNEHLNNAIYENTPRNGILTAIEDFLNETELDLSFYSIKLFHGLGIICPNTKKNNSIIETTILNSNITYNAEIFHLKNSLNKNKIISELKKNNTLLIQEKNKLIQTEEQLKNKLTSQKDYGEIKNLLTSVKYENNNLTKNENNLKEIIEYNKHLINEQKTQISLFIQRENILTHTTEEYNNRIIEQKNTIQTLNNTKEEMQKEITQQKNTIQTLNNTKEEMQKEITQQKNTIQTLNNTKEEMQKEITQQKNTIQTLNNTKEEMQKEITQQKNTIQTLNNTKEEMQKEITQQKNTIQTLNNTKEEMQKEITQQKNTIQTLNNTKEEMQKEITQQKNTIQTLNNDLKNNIERTVKLTNTKKEMQKEITQQKNTIQTLNNDLKNNIERTVKLTNTKKEMQKEITQQKNTIQTLNNTKEEMQKEMQKEITQQKNTIQTLIEENNKYKKDIEVYKTSNSWKITSPLRKLKNFFK